MDAVIGDLKRKHILPIRIKHKTSWLDLALPPLSQFSRRLDIDELIIFSRQMFVPSKSGITITQAIAGLHQNSRSKQLKQF